MLHLATCYLLYMFPVMLFIIPGKWLKVIILLCLVVRAYDMMKLGVLWPYLLMVKSDEQGEMATAVPSLYFGNLAETSSNYTFYLFSSENRSVGETPSFTSVLFSRLVSTALENF